MEYCKRLIEVDLPIKRISQHARQEKEKRRGHVPLLYIWPATRPTSSCRAVLCATMWPDPMDKNCPEKFIIKARSLMQRWADTNLHLMSNTSYLNFIRYQKDKKLLDNKVELQKALFDFIADFANWDNSTEHEFLLTSRSLTQAAFESLGGLKKSQPLIVDPFSGGGAIPLESLRIGTQSFAGELNTVATFFNKILLEYLVPENSFLIDELNKWYTFITKKLRKELHKYFPENGNQKSVAYLWSRSIVCEGPGCGFKIPLLRTKLLNRKGKIKHGIKFVPNAKNKNFEFEIVSAKKINFDIQGTIKRGNAICPKCGYTTISKSVRNQLNKLNGGADDSILYCVVTVSNSDSKKGRNYRVPDNVDLKAFNESREKANKLRKENHGNRISNFPNENLPEPLPGRSGTLGIGLQGYGINQWEHLFNSRQLLTHYYLIHLSQDYIESLELDLESKKKIISVIALAIARSIDLNASLCVWQLNTPNTAHVFGRWALSMVMDYGEINPLSEAGGSLTSIMKRIIPGIEYVLKSKTEKGVISNSAAQEIPLPNDSTEIVFTDPPYYDAVPYSDLSDFFYVWFKRLLNKYHQELFSNYLTNKDQECIVDPNKNKDKDYYVKEMQKTMTEIKRILKDDGLCVIVFAHKSTSGWEAQLQAMLNAGWVFTNSWPIDTEMQSRLRAKNSATLSSSIHIVCRPRLKESVGDWRDILNQLPKRIHQWMPRLQKEGIVGADAIFACLGPALEIFSQYSEVEKASGEKVTLKDYLEHVWAAVAKEALNMIFEDADASGFEEDSRLTAMWLWTLFADKSTNGEDDAGDDQEPEDDSEEEASIKKKKIKGYVLEYDAARKIAQGLGIHLENLKSVVDVKGETATLLSVGERAKYLFAKEDVNILPKKAKRKAQQTFDFMKEIEKEESETAIINELARMNTAETTLDKLHQTMLLFAANRGEAMKRLLVEEGFGRDNNFWKLAQALSALYPAGSDEKRWVDGVLARKKGLGF